MSNAFLRGLNSVKNFAKKELNSVASILGITTKPAYVTYSRTYMGDCDITNYSVLPQNISEQVHSLLNQGSSFASIFYPKLTNYGLAPDIVKNSGTIVGSVQNPALLNNGFLSKITVYVASTGSVVGMLQYFGGVPGVYIGITGVSTEVNFEIPIGDYITQAWVLYSSTSGGIAAIRFFTQNDRDSGWIGSVGAGRVLCAYTSFAPSSTGLPQHLRMRPIYCFDGWSQSGGAALTLGARFCDPYAVTLTVADIAAATGADGKPLSVSDTWSRSWNFTNGSSVAQETSVSDTITATNSHTVSRTQSNATTVTTSFSFMATAIFEGGMASGNFSRTATSARTTTTSNSTTLTTVAEQFFNYPLIVPAKTNVVCDVSVYQAISTATLTMTVQWLGATPSSSATTLYYSGTDDFVIVTNIAETALA